MSTTKNVKEIIKEDSGFKVVGTQTEKFLKATEKYNELIRRGLTEKRGNQLMGVEKVHRATHFFNNQL